jgi:membrane protein DedA with SNARE-associated domain
MPLRKMQNTIYPCKHLFTASYLAVFCLIPSASVILLYSASCALSAHQQNKYAVFQGSGAAALAGCSFLPSIKCC